MLRKIILYGLLIVHTSANIGLTNRGMHFVVACPWLKEKNDACEATVTTAEQMVHYNVSETENVNENYLEKAIKRSDVDKIIIAVKKDSTNPDKSRIYGLRVIKATGPIRIVVLAYKHKSPLDNIDAFVLIPKSSCYRSYYITTGHANPFIAVMSFDAPSTEITIQIPWLFKSMEVFCSLDKDCERGKSLPIKLSSYKVWYFSYEDSVQTMNGAQIKTDFPVYVISGNVDCWNQEFEGSTDTCISEMKPIVTWGKTYIVPSVIPRSMSFRINAIRYPLVVSFIEQRSVPKQVKVTDDQPYHYETSNTVAITSDHPFGVYQMFASRRKTHLNSDEGDASILNLIPVEQWLHGILYTRLDFDPGSNVKYVLITNAEQKDVILDGIRKEIKWYISTVRTGGKTYSVGELNLRNAVATIRINKTSATIMLYLMMHPLQPDVRGFMACPYDFHLGEIYQDNCKSSGRLSPNDGVDNDCDGFVDEEIKNNLDDDADDLKDEDYVATHSHGEWSSWKTLCNVSCLGNVQTVRVRSCFKSPYGRDCEGDSLQCNNGTCPDTCGNITKCYCNAGCKTCKDSIFQCDSCKSGYKPSEHCTTPCSAGWGGPGCMDVKLKDKPDSTWRYWLLIILVLVIVFIVILVALQ